MLTWRRFLQERKVPAVTADQVAARLQCGQAPVLLDVREAEEWAAGHIPGAVWIPLGELPQRLAELPKDREIVCVCRSGHRSEMATLLLRAHGFDARNLTGGMLNWTGRVVAPEEDQEE